MDRDDDFLHKLDLIFAYIKELLKVQQQAFSRQEELFALMTQKDTPLELESVVKDPWLTKAAVMDELCITSRTFYRRRKLGNWTVMESGGEFYYLKSSLRR